MKKLIQICSLLSLIVAFSFLSANAQNTTKIEAQIPFDFNIAGKQYPAGAYNLRVTNSRSVGVLVQLTDRENNNLGTLLVSLANGGMNSEAKLIFDNYEGQRFLSRIDVREGSYRVLRSGVKRHTTGEKKSKVQSPEVVALALKTEL